MRPRALLGAVAAFVGLLAPGGAANACAGGHLGVQWASFQPPASDFGPAFFYHSVEPATSANVPITIKGTGDDCSNPPQPVVGTYRVSNPPSGTPRAAASGLDYTPIFPERNTGPLFGNHAQGPTEHQDAVTVQGDALIEPVAESAQAIITTSTGRRDFPWDVPFYILDDDGTERASFETTGPYERSETYGSIFVPVFRGGPATGNTSYAVSAAPSGDSPATPGQDYEAPGSPVTFGPGERVALVEVKVFDEHRPEPPEELTLTLTEPGTILPDDPATATVRILDSLSASGLESRLHHPRQRYKYRASDFRIREVHIFTEAGLGPPVTSADFALRRNDVGGKCAWWSGKRFRRGGCEDQRWLKTGVYEPDFFFIRIEELRPSRGSIRSYTAYSRARNGTSDIELELERGRNYNTFEVKPRK